MMLLRESGTSEEGCREKQREKQAGLTVVPLTSYAVPPFLWSKAATLKFNTHFNYFVLRLSGFSCVQCSWCHDA